MRISDWSSDVCSSDLLCCARWQRESDLCPRAYVGRGSLSGPHGTQSGRRILFALIDIGINTTKKAVLTGRLFHIHECHSRTEDKVVPYHVAAFPLSRAHGHHNCPPTRNFLSRSEEPTSELQSLMRISYAVFCLKKKK